MEELAKRTLLDNVIKKNESVFITFNTIFIFKEIEVYENIIRPNYDKYIQYLKIDIFKNMSRLAILRVLLERKEKNFIDWIAREEYNKMMHAELDKYFISSFSNSIPTDFAHGILKLMSTNDIGKLVISIDMRDKNGLLIISNMFKHYEFTSRVFLVDNDKTVIEEYIKNSEYSLIVTDEEDILENNLKYLEGRTVCIPFTGYNFNISEMDENDKPLMVSNKEWEFKSVDYKFNLGFVELFKMTEEMYYMG